MKKSTGILICTQTVDRNDPILGFFHRWIEEFAKHRDKVIVVCLKEGEYALPSNVEVIALGKTSRLIQAWRLWWVCVSRRREYDAVFVHMNPEYIVAAGVLWRPMKKRVALWYTHKSVNLKLRLAVFLAHSVFTASRESFRLQTKKLHVMGHGIDTGMFHEHAPSKGTLRIITVGRISQTKRLSEMLDVLGELHERHISFSFSIVGTPVLVADMRYAGELTKKILALPFSSSVHMLGAKQHKEIPGLLARADVFLNLSATGSFDKAVLEAILAGVAPVTTNEAFRTLLEPYGLYVETLKPELLAQAIERASRADVTALRAEVIKRHSLANLIPRMLSLFYVESA